MLRILPLCSPSFLTPAVSAAAIMAGYTLLRLSMTRFSNDQFYACVSCRGSLMTSMSLASPGMNCLEERDVAKPSSVPFQVYVSWMACAAFALGVLPALVATTGWAGLAKFWLMPWLGYHFWMSTFTVTLTELTRPQC